MGQKRANELGADYLATGHYARVVREISQGDGITESTQEYKLLRAVDASRDQSYFLYGMSQKELSQIMFPLGELTKVEVRKIGRKAGISTSDKPDSQEICFVPKDYSEFVEKRIQGQVISGNLIDEAGKVLGKHEGIHQFTVGQRKGIQIPTTLPMYVSKIDKTTGNVTIGSKEALKKSAFDVRELRWVNAPVQVGDRLLTQIRSRFYPSQAVIEEVAEETVRVKFEVPQESISPGQAAVFYKDNQVIGGGWISKVIG